MSLNCKLNHMSKISLAISLLALAVALLAFYRSTSEIGRFQIDSHGLALDTKTGQMCTPSDLIKMGDVMPRCKDLR